MNRIAIAFGKARTLTSKLDEASQAKLSASLDMDAGEHAHLQTLKSAMVGTALTLEEAHEIYVVMGEHVNVFNSRPVHQKVVITKLMAELMQR